MRRVILAATTILAALPALAQEAEPELIYVNVVQVKPDMVPEWEDLYRNEVMPALKKTNMPAWAQVWETAVLGQHYSYAFVAPIPGFNVFDGKHPVERALGEEAFHRLAAKIRKCQVNSQGMVQRMRPDLSIEKEDVEPNLAVVVDVAVMPGRSSDYEEWIRTKVLPAMRKADVDGLWVSQTVMGDNPNLWTILVLHPDFAAFDKGPPLVRALGPEGAEQLLRETAGVVQSVKYSVMRLRPDLSHLGGQ